MAFRIKLPDENLNVENATLKDDFSIRKRVEQKDNVAKNEMKKDEVLSKNLMSKFFIRVFGEDNLKEIREKNYVVLRKADSSNSNEQWLESFFEDYFSEEMQGEMKQNISDSFLNPLEKLEKSNHFLSQELNKYHKLLKKQNETVEMKFLIDDAIGDDEKYENMATLLKDSLKKSEEESSKFIIPFLFSLQKIMALKNFEFISNEKKIDTYLDVTKKLLSSISGCFISHRKELLAEIAQNISKEFNNICFVSSEDYTFVEPKIHNVPLDGGEKVLEGKSFAVVNKENKNTIIYADIIAQ